MLLEKYCKENGYAFRSNGRYIWMARIDVNGTREEKREKMGTRSKRIKFVW